MLILMVTLFTLCMSSVVHAESNEAAQVLIGQYQDMRLNCEAGINYYDFCDLYRNLYVATMKQQGNIDKVTFDNFRFTVNCYKVAMEHWDKPYDSLSINNYEARTWINMAKDEIDEISKDINK